MAATMGKKKETTMQAIGQAMTPNHLSLLKATLMVLEALEKHTWFHFTQETSYMKWKENTT